jgi:apolipoprotein N-acyltransferase
MFNSASFDESGVPGYFNSAHLLDREGRAVYRYDKNHLVPFGEYLPWAGILGFAEALVAEVSGFKAGEASETGTLDGLKFGTLICYEAIFPELSREAANNGANLLVNLTNDGWFGRTSAPSQHLQMAAFRCIENRKPMLRAANSGYSAAIDTKGVVQARTKLFEETLLLVDVTVNSERTLFGFVGSWICIAIIILSIGIFTVARTRKEGANS